MNYLYHFVPPNLVGQTIFPMDMLETLYPQVAEIPKRKYANRPLLPLQHIFPLNCLWREVVFLSAVHPRDTAAAFKSCGMRLKRNQFFRIDARKIDPSLATIWLATSTDKGENTFVPFDPLSLEKYSKFPEKTLEYYREMIAEKREREILIYARVPHILFKGSIDVSDAEIIEV